MKRSEMVNLIKDEFLAYGITVNSAVDIGLDELANRILEEIECAGMIPPTIEFKMGGSLIRDNCWNNE